jgi:hypothetical protein
VSENQKLLLVLGVFVLICLGILGLLAVGLLLAVALGLSGGAGVVVAFSPLLLAFCFLLAYFLGD